MKSVINVNNLSWSYNGGFCISDIDLQIKEGSFTGIIGPNGSGKTTLLRNISSSLKPRKDTVYIENKDILSYSTRHLAQKMSFVPQSTQVDFDFTVLDIVLMGRNPYLGRLQDEGEIDLRIAREAMEVTGTLNLHNRKITSLSGGERQRVIIARAIAQQANIILLDEPISHLDIRHQIEILNLLEQLVKEHHKTVVTVLHDLNLSARYCNYLILLDNGRIYCKGTPAEVLTPENIQNIYGIKVTMLQHPSRSIPYIVPCM
jgi:iron complex transport system ATP-binding protein